MQVVGPELLSPDFAAVRQRQERSLANLLALELDVAVALGQLQRGLGGGEENLVLPSAEPERTTDAAGEEEDICPALVHPRGRHRAAQLVECFGQAVGVFGGREDRRGVDGHFQLGADEAVAGEDLLVVHDDPVVDPDHAPWRTGWLLASIVGWPLV